MANDVYQTPFNSRYAGKLSLLIRMFIQTGHDLNRHFPGDEMKSLFSPRSRYSTWRQLWLWLAEAQKRIDSFSGSMFGINST